MAERQGFAVKDLVVASIHPEGKGAWPVDYDRNGAERLLHMARAMKRMVAPGYSEVRTRLP